MSNKETNSALAIVVGALEELKAQAIEVIDVRGKTNVTDVMVIASGTSARHVSSIAENVVEHAKKRQLLPLGVEGGSVGEWVLVDLGDIIVHVMQPAIRNFYQLEKLWRTDLLEASEDH